ncbi:hypothetical protein JAAARDRAFT_40347 [Jaapia argillacea MUCL 33604]|uniref:RNI-like protein n=1 Tax=Jaapia argillacea MUCL 33604 TaxID=933084 RepID=A0A067PBD1_9AGAM|nr:hypothetical protein JAAARDRAFT_40347 [Jaapia argillacea MUCL 33604]
MSTPSCSPSSSAVTIPTPGKSILKRPPPPQTSFFSLARLSKLLPSQPPSSSSSTLLNPSNASNYTLPSTSSSTPKDAGKDTGKDGVRAVADETLKRAHFILPQLVTVYPISSAAPPSTPGLKEEKRLIEERERERRRRVVRQHSFASLPSTPTLPSPGVVDSPSTSLVPTTSVLPPTPLSPNTPSAVIITTPTWDEQDYWSPEKVDGFYRECCAGREEEPMPGISNAFKRLTSPPRSLDLSGLLLSPSTSAILSDVFTIEWGLRKLVLRECDLDEAILKPILHALLIPQSLTFLSLASNRKMKERAFKLVGAFVWKAKSLQFLDLSQNFMDKRCVEYVASALGSLPVGEGASGIPGTTGAGATAGAGTAGTGGGAGGAGAGGGQYTGLESLKLDDCGLRSTALDALAHTVRTSSLRHISLRYNKISTNGAVALALMIRDYPDTVPLPMAGSVSAGAGYPQGQGTGYSGQGAGYALAVQGHSAPGYSSSISSVPSSPVTSLSMMGSGGSVSGSGTSTPNGSLAFSPPGTPTLGNMGLPPSSPPPPYANQVKAALSKAGPPPPPPRHPNTLPQTTYTPYIPRSRRPPPPQGQGQNQITNNTLLRNTNPLSASGEVVPIITSSAQGGITTRHVNETTRYGDGSTRQGDGRQVNGRSRGGGVGGGQGRGVHQGPSAALLDKVRALDALPRLGALRTLDLKGNDIRGGVTYIAQVLKRNRTLKVLNLSENKLDVTCLVAIAEALKYNSCLETLDLSKNPCCGPGLEGIQSLRTAFTLNTSLKRLFLSSTSLSTQGAIALAEFLPESTSLLHLDLTCNEAIGIAGVMALSEGLKKNWVMRCLDLNIPPGDEEMARMCRDILNSCIRNTEEAEKSADSSVVGAFAGSGRGLGKGVWGLIEESELAKHVRRDEEKKVGSDVVVQAYVCKAQLEEYFNRLQSPTDLSSQPPPPPPEQSLVQKSRSLLPALTAQIQTTADPTRLEELLGLNDSLMELLARLDASATGGQGQGTPGQFKGLGLVIDTKRLEGGLGGGSVAVGGETDSGETSENGHVVGREEEEDGLPSTPRVDKGKGRAEPEPPEPEKILSPTFLISESDDEEDGVNSLALAVPIGGGDVRRILVTDDGEEVLMPSPTDRSRVWIEEEGEIFRKGNVLLGPEEMEGEYAGEDLRRELLEAQVERPPPRPIVDEFGMEIPVNHHSSTDKLNSPLTENIPEEQKKPPPRPYIPRRSSTASSISLTLSGIASPQHDGARSPSPNSATMSPSTPISPAASRPFFTRRGSATSSQTAEAP